MTRVSIKATGGRNPTRYDSLIEKVFFDKFSDGATKLEFERADIKDAAKVLDLKLPDNLGDVIYAFRFRAALPSRVIETQPEGREWIIQLAGRGKYRFRLARANRIVPNKTLATIKIPDNTPEIIMRYPLDDEQALLAKVRYNRLIDIFLGLTTYSLQNHLRTTVAELGQIEIDELYIGIDKHGCHYIIPVQAKGGTDQISIVQTEQDIKWCKQEFPELRCKAISAQFVSAEQIALFELKIEDEELLELKIVEERHYKLVPARDLDKDEISAYRS
ncbi:endonuclease [Rhizobacter sp. SG703]|uniref:endonuclease n=1 Tax=Rhizobacter sp. SG703 TaxID=2587140 RepID=UPI0014486592|nr:endonuclease [Rhizobacter sp. SG703]NKI94673.1 hypothetical protein [Rhizobacter sp. SG703]